MYAFFAHVLLLTVLNFTLALVCRCLQVLATVLDTYYRSNRGTAQAKPPRCDPTADLEYFDCTVTAPALALPHIAIEDEDARVDVDDSHTVEECDTAGADFQNDVAPAAPNMSASPVLRITASLGYTLTPLTMPFRPQTAST